MKKNHDKQYNILISKQEVYILILALRRLPKEYHTREYINLLDTMILLYNFMLYMGY